MKTLSDLRTSDHRAEDIFIKTIVFMFTLWSLEGQTCINLTTRFFRNLGKLINYILFKRSNFVSSYFSQRWNVYVYIHMHEK